MKFRSVKVVVVAFTLLLASCGSDEPAAPTAADLLRAIEGRELTPAEVTELTDAAEVLCGLDASVLAAIWKDLEPDQFEFQNFVFDYTCPERELQVQMRQARGEATTVPPSTTTQPRRTTTTRRQFSTPSRPSTTSTTTEP